jgi:hypothetical protein
MPPVVASTGCIFCGSSPTSKEHIISRWAFDVVSKDPRGLPPLGQHTRYNEHGIQQVWESARAEFIAKCVCKGCNGGWMSGIEDAARPILSRMIRSEQVILDHQAQNDVAAWLGLKAIVERYSQSPTRPVEPEWITYFHEHHRPPDTWCIRIGRYDGNRPIRMASGPITMLSRHNLVPFILKSPGLLFSLALGYFFGQVVGVGRKTVLPKRPELFSQIWPHPLLRLDPPQGAHDELMAWPPQGWLADADLERYSYNITGEPPPSI